LSAAARSRMNLGSCLGLRSARSTRQRSRAAVSSHLRQESLDAVDEFKTKMTTTWTTRSSRGDCAFSGVVIGVLMFTIALMVLGRVSLPTLELAFLSALISGVAVYLNAAKDQVITIDRFSKALTVGRLWPFGICSKNRIPFEEIRQVRIEFLPGSWICVDPDSGGHTSQDSWKVTIATASARRRLAAVFESAKRGDATGLAKHLAAAAQAQLVEIRP